MIPDSKTSLIRCLSPFLPHFILGLVLGVFFHYLLYRIFLPAEPFIYVSF